MQRERSLYLDKETYRERRKRTIISSGGLPSTPKESLQHPSEGFSLNIKDTGKCLVKKNRKGYPDIPFGITPLSCSQEHPPHYQDDSSPSPRAKSPKHRSS